MSRKVGATASAFRLSEDGAEPGGELSSVRMKEPLQAPPLGTPLPGPPPRVRRSRIAGFLEWTLIVILSADTVAVLLMEGTAEAQVRTWPKLTDFAGSMIDQLGRTGELARRSRAPGRQAIEGTGVSDTCRRHIEQSKLRTRMT